MDVQPVLSIDLGGTKILSALINGDRVLVKEYTPTQAERGINAVVRNLCTAVDRVLESGHLKPGQLDGMVVAAAGAIDTQRGVVTLSPNLPGWRNVPLAKLVEEFYSVPVALVNDANAQAIGEHRLGAGRQTRNMIFLTVSTGIGGGIIINNRIYEGAGGAAGEIGHMTIDVDGPRCACGNRGCLEILASGTAIARAARKRLEAGEYSLLREMVSGDLDSITAQEVDRAARHGDNLAKEVIEQAAFYLGVGLANLVNIFNPEAIVIGGGVSLMGDLFLEPARRVVVERAFPYSGGMVKILAGELGDEAGVLGAALWLRDKKS